VETFGLCGVLQHQTGRLPAQFLGIGGVMDRMFFPVMLILIFGSLYYITNGNQFIKYNPALFHFLQKTPSASLPFVLFFFSNTLTSKKKILIGKCN
jgi:hypothetical protein